MQQIGKKARGIPLPPQKKITKNEKFDRKDNILHISNWFVRLCKTVKNLVLSFAYDPSLKSALESNNLPRVKAFVR